MTRIALNGLGRIGKLVLRDLVDSGAGGEIVLLIGPPGEIEATAEDAETLLREALVRLKPSHAAAEVAKATGLDRKALYARALELK